MDAECFFKKDVSLFAVSLEVLCASPVGRGSCSDEVFPVRRWE